MNSGESGHTVREVPVYEVLAADIKSVSYTHLTLPTSDLV